jgi:hypothetical protein
VYINVPVDPELTPVTIMPPAPRALATPEFAIELKDKVPLLRVTVPVKVFRLVSVRIPPCPPFFVIPKLPPISLMSPLMVR